MNHKDDGPDQAAERRRDQAEQEVCVAQRTEELQHANEELRTEVAERKRTEDALRASEERFRNLFERHSAVKLVLDSDTGAIVDANAAAVQFYGWPLEELKQMRIEQINTLPPEAVKAALAEAASSQNARFEFRHRRADGSIRDVEVFSNRIEIAGKGILHSIVHDITARKQAEEELRRMALMVDTAPNSITVHDFGGRFFYANQRTLELHGYSRDEFMTLNLRQLDVPADERLITARMQEIVERGEAFFEVAHFRKDGTTLPLEVSIKVTTWGGNDAILSVATDITERKRAEAEKATLEGQLQQAQKMESVGRLAGGVAHDFNNMLGVILGHTEMAMDQVDPSQPLYADLQEIRKAAGRSVDLTRQLLAFARKQTIAPRVLDLNETVAGMLKMLQRLIGEDIHLDWQPQANLWPVKMDPSQIDQILANLCVNARDSIADVGTVAIETGHAVIDAAACVDRPGFAPGEYVRIAVSDNGCGMAPATLAHIFEPFFTTKGVGKGTGLGLATVYGAVKQNDGFIHASSELGRGTTFTIYLPRHKGKAEQMGAEGAPGPSAPGHETILLVEDEPAVLQLGRTMLERLGYRVIAAETPGEAIRLAEEHVGRIHLLMTDVVMPEMNGRDLAKRVLSLYPDLTCLFMSGYTADVIAHQGVLDAGVLFIQKPFTRNDLTAKLLEALNR